MTDDNPETADDPDERKPPEEGDEVPHLRSEVEALRSELEATEERLRAAERNLRWMAQRQATETGTSVCPSCNSGGALTVERTMTGKKKVVCRRCGERFV